VPSRNVPPTGSALLEELGRDLADVERSIRSHRFLDALAERLVPEDRLRAFAGEQFSIVTSDRRSFAFLAARFPTGPAGDFFLAMAEGEGQALSLLVNFAAWLGLEPDQLAAHEPEAGAQAYPAFVAWLALNGSRSDVVLALLANLAAWGANCARMSQSLRERYGAHEEAVAFFDFFATPPPGFEERALALLDDALRSGDSPWRARRAARLLQAYELRFWDTVAERVA
jgi:thiaminase